MHVRCNSVKHSIFSWMNFYLRMNRITLNTDWRLCVGMFNLAYGPYLLDYFDSQIEYPMNFDSFPGTFYLFRYYKYS